jgi:hypothetical protein
VVLRIDSSSERGAAHATAGRRSTTRNDQNLKMRRLAQVVSDDDETEEVLM